MNVSACSKYAGLPWWDAVRDQLTAAMRLVHANVPVVIPRDLDEPREFVVADAGTTTGVIAAILVSGGSAIYFMAARS